MKKLFLVAILIGLLTTSLFAYEVVFSENNNGYFVVYDDNRELTVDDTVFFKNVGEVTVQQWEDKIYTLTDDDEVLIICLSDVKSDVESFFLTFNYRRNEVIGVITNTTVSFVDYLKTGDTRYIFSDNLSNDDIVKAKKKRINVLPYSNSIIYEIDDDEITYIDSSLNKTKVVCPNCGTVFFI